MFLRRPDRNLFVNVPPKSFQDIEDISAPHLRHPTITLTCRVICHRELCSCGQRSAISGVPSIDQVTPWWPMFGWNDSSNRFFEISSQLYEMPSKNRTPEKSSEETTHIHISAFNCFNAVRLGRWRLANRGIHSSSVCKHLLFKQIIRSLFKILPFVLCLHKAVQQNLPFLCAWFFTPKKMSSQHPIFFLVQEAMGFHAISFIIIANLSWSKGFIFSCHHP